MTDVLEFARHIFDSYEAYRLPVFHSRRIAPEQFQSIRGQLVEESHGLLRMKRAGLSFEGRPINLISVGEGKTSVLLWSQMHGDESTATMAVADILKYLISTREEPPTQTMLGALTMHFLPMLNPDGAARFQRRTAQGIDLNRDARALTTPEAKVLRKLQSDLRPAYGFNLHDQELSTVGTSNRISTMALLAPAFDDERSDDEVRTCAKQLASTFAAVVEQFIPANLSRYDDSFEPRAFGDNMQKWGTSTLLVESGHEPEDPEKESIRKLNVVGILASLFAIASDALGDRDLTSYEMLPINGKRAYDVIIRNATVLFANLQTLQTDIAVSYQVDTHPEDVPLLVDVGDLSTFVGLREIAGTVRPIAADKLVHGKPFEWEEYVKR